MYQYTDFDRRFVHARAAQYRDQLERHLSGQLGGVPDGVLGVVLHVEVRAQALHDVGEDFTRDQDFGLAHINGTRGMS